jgi:hypothetical protein
LYVGLLLIALSLSLLESSMNAGGSLTSLWSETESLSEQIALEVEA